MKFMVFSIPICHGCTRLQIERNGDVGFRVWVREIKRDEYVRIRDRLRVWVLQIERKQYVWPRGWLAIRARCFETYRTPKFQLATLNQGAVSFFSSVN